MTHWVPDLPVVPLDAPPHILDLVEPFRGRGAAVVDAGGSLDHAELDERSAVVATALRAAGVEPDSPVVVHARLSRWAVVAMLGVLRAGARYVPVDAGFPVARQRYIAEASGARFAVSEPGLDVRLDGLRTVPADTDGPRGGTVRGTLAYTCFTSGSTGRPKGVTISAAALAASTAARLAYYPTPVSTFLLCSSISFDSSVAGIYWTLACGGRLVIPSDRPADLLAVGRAARDHRASHLLMLPSLYDIALRGGLAERAGTLSTVIVAGEACPPDLVRQHFDALPGTRLYNEYGPTECTVWSAVHECTPVDADLPDVPIGGAVPGTSLYVRSAAGAAVPPGEPGELHIGGPGLAEPARELYRTGDIVSVTAGAELRFHGRADHQLKLGGMRVDRSEIEQALRTHRDVAAAAVGVCTVQGRKKVVGFVSPTTGEVDRRSLRAHLIERLPAVAVPSRIVALPRLPVLPNGKVDHGAIDELAHDTLLQKN
ncbi:amino acid adenylation domain-containing protein [Kitasatospora sp. NPDC058184]|uniref:amino acid adenylation domain-containing protein n=1 Tax=unclassified Kitasatospora TaxID=2633591 RepID=UPI0036AAA22F